MKKMDSFLFARFVMWYSSEAPTLNLVGVNICNVVRKQCRGKEGEADGECNDGDRIKVVRGRIFK